MERAGQLSARSKRRVRAMAVASGCLLAAGLAVIAWFVVWVFTAARRPRRCAPSEPATKKLKFPTAFTVLAAVLVLVWVASFFVPAGAYDIDPKAGGPVPGSYHELPSCANAQGDELCVETAFDQRLKQLFIAPSNGLYGIESERGFVSADETGALYGSAMIARARRALKFASRWTIHWACRVVHLLCSRSPVGAAWWLCSGWRARL